jgi:hypothetical protein
MTDHRPGNSELVREGSFGRELPNRSGVPLTPARKDHLNQLLAVGGAPSVGRRICHQRNPQSAVASTSGSDIRFHIANQSDKSNQSCAYDRSLGIPDSAGTKRGA